MLSIRRRQGPHAIESTSSFGDSDGGWAGWGDFGPMLLRSVGIAGIAGVIMAIAAGDVFFGEPPRTSARSGTQDEAESGGVVVAASLSPDDTAADVAIAPESEAPATVEADPVASGAEEALAFYEERVKQEDTARAEPPASGPAAAETDFSLSSPSLYSPSDTKRFEVAAASPAGVQEEGGAAASGAGVQETDTEQPRSMAASAGAAEGDADDLWAAEALECPRDWLDVSDTAMADGPADCEAEVALATEADASADDEAMHGTLDATSGAEPGVHDELESALATQALKQIGFIARVPQARPDPPPVRRVRRSQPSSWPDEPPPNCGKLHAYWHFTDRKAGKKEWYCR